MSDEELLDDVRAWLEKGGYILEMGVAKALRSMTPMVEQAFHYRDPLTQKDREGDVAATFFPEAIVEGRTTHSLQVMVECKSSTAPWIFFMGSAWTNGDWLPGWHMQPNCEVCEAMANGLDRVARSVPNAYAVTEKHTAAARNAEDHAYQAVQQITSAALGTYGSADTWRGHDLNPQVVSALVEAIVVTTSPLITCRLNNSGELVLERVPRVVVSVRRDGIPDEANNSMRVTVMRPSQLTPWVETVLEAAPLSV